MFPLRLIVLEDMADLASVLNIVVPCLTRQLPLAKALRLISIPMYLVSKDWTIIFIAFGEVLRFEYFITEPMFLSLALIALASVVSACADIWVVISDYSSDPYESAAQVMSLNVGHCWIFLNCFSGAALAFSIRKKSKLAHSDFHSNPPFSLDWTIIFIAFGEVLRFEYFIYY